MSCLWAGIQAGLAAASKWDEKAFNGVVSDVCVGCERLSIHRFPFNPEHKPPRANVLIALPADFCISPLKDVNFRNKGIVIAFMWADIFNQETRESKRSSRAELD